MKTVSRVVNNESRIADNTRQRVLATIEKLQYRPNLVARGLVTQRTYTVGLVVGDIANPFYAEVARGVQDIAQTKGYNIYCCHSDQKQQLEIHTLHTLAAQGVDGIIIFPNYNSGNNISTFVKQYRPLVVGNYFVQHPNASLITIDHYRGATLAVDYLVGKSHTEIGMLTGLDETFRERQHIQGFRDALKHHNLQVIDNYILSSKAPTPDSGYETTLQLLFQYPQVTAIFAYNDLLAMGAIRACQELGRRIPADCAIIGFDDIQLAPMFTPALTSVRVNKFGVGRQAMIRLLAMLDDPEATFPPIKVDVELVIRESA